MYQDAHSQTCGDARDGACADVACDATDGRQRGEDVCGGFVGLCCREMVNWRRSLGWKE